MLKYGAIKGVGRQEAASALAKGGETFFGQLYKRNRGQVSKFMKGIDKGGDDFLRANINIPGRSARRVMGGLGSGPGGVGRQAFNIGAGSPNQYAVAAARREMAYGAAKYNLIGGVGGVAAGVGMLSGGAMLGGSAGSLMSEVPLPPEEIQNANMYITPRRAYTQRQRSLQAISMTQLSLRSAFGQEARYMHR